MYRRMRLTAGVLALAAGIAPVADLTSSVESSAALGAAARTTSPSVTIAQAPKDVTQGDRFAVTVRVGSASQARTVEIQMQTEDYAGTKYWTRLRATQVRGTARHVFKLVATGVDTQRLRALATYRGSRSVASKPFGVTVWQWTDLAGIPSYYSTNGVSDHPSSQFGMNGDQYIGWYTYGPYGMWEARYTPGRHCKAFRGVFGVTDSSGDGSSAEFALLADETSLVYQSPALVPGAVETVEFEVASPYRFAIQARDTSPEDVYAFPAIGNPQFLCSTEF